MIRAAIYARFSSQLQSDASIEDQLRICRERAVREDWTVTEVFSDAAISGASMLRPGLQNMIAAASHGDFDVLLAEALDRLSRDQADVATLFKRLSFHGVRIVTLSEGEINELHVGLKGTMNQLFLKTSQQRPTAVCVAALRPDDPVAATATAIKLSGGLVPTVIRSLANARSTNRKLRSSAGSFMSSARGFLRRQLPESSIVTVSLVRAAKPGAIQPFGVTASAGPVC